MTHIEDATCTEEKIKKLYLIQDIKDSILNNNIKKIHIHLQTLTIITIFRI